jgi:hypothetical protein
MARKFKVPRIPLKRIWRTLTGPAARHLVKNLIVRVYALLILCLVLAAGYLALHYLVRQVFYPPRLPDEITHWQARLDVAALRVENSPGITQDAARPPISHYHGVEQWFQSDRFNGCTQSGCHDPLPHGQKAKVPAFANFHSTFLACEMCHQPSAQHPGETRWINTDTAQPQDTPDILKLLAYLETRQDEIASDPSAAHATITRLLTGTLAATGEDQLLDQLQAEMDSAQPASPVWKHAVILLTSELPQHTRGEYRAKLVWAVDAPNRRENFDEMTAQAKLFLAAPVDSPQRKQIQTALHAPLAKEAAACISCHEERPGMLDFPAAGYSPKRSVYLSRLEIAICMQKIRQGGSFYLPTLHQEEP